MSKKRKMFLLFCFIIIDIFLLVCFLFIRDVTEENKLKKEVQALTKLDITKDRYNTKIKSRGNYAIVEKNIKEYLDNYAVNLQSVLKIMNDSQFSSLLSVSNYQNDGPDFVVSLKYIDDKQKQFNQDIDELIDDCNEDSIKSYINKTGLDSYYISLYEELMLDEDMTNDFLNTKNMLEETKEKVNNIFDTSREIFNFLQVHKDEWKIEDNQIKLQTEDLVNQYNQLVSKIK